MTRWASFSLANIGRELNTYHVAPDDEEMGFRDNETKKNKRKKRKKEMMMSFVVFVDDYIAIVVVR